MPDLYFSVSQIDRFREWLADEDSDVESLIADLTEDADTPDMRRGRAFHGAIETVLEGRRDDLDEIKYGPYTFIFQGDFELPSIPYQEVKGYKTYDGLRVGCRVDGLKGNHIIDHKAATWFDAERYMAKYAWRYYLDIFTASRFTWDVWEMKETDNPLVWLVTDLHVLEQYRYPGMEGDCRELAAKMKDFALTCRPAKSGGKVAQRYNQNATLVDLMRDKKREREQQKVSKMVVP